MGVLIRLLTTGIISVTMGYWLGTLVVYAKDTGNSDIALGCATIAICVVIFCMSRSLRNGASGQTQVSGDSEQSSSPLEPNGSVEKDRIL